ncbi:MAG: aminotransferase class III-fold pyridoxal phosphate-dependent enzyme, partial [bacterium]|nr:aminotransferase class III-fold pyridoxal phosphate-dependent enzyme [bacterium]
MPATTSQHLRRGDLLPRILTPPPGPRARELSRRLAEVEAPGINTLAGDAPNLLWHEARGANVLDVDGNRYLDLTAGFGVAAVGHRHPRVVAALRRQSARLVHGLGDAAGHEPRLELATRLRELAVIDDAQTYFAVSGADAVEIALKTAILATGRPAILAFEPAYHGLTLGALAVTSRPEFRRPFTPYLHPHLRRLPFGCDPRRIAAELDRGDVPGCVVVEPIAGREGILVPPAGWLRELAALCRRRRVLLAVDEIFTGLGRTGR